ncbi:MAG: DUF6515 family protein [Bacteroidales bacterium]|jgi:hypothetical protein|nr:DUF6515 family protein [Bacteroidales bacterium]
MKTHIAKTIASVIVFALLFTISDSFAHSKRVKKQKKDKKVVVVHKNGKKTVYVKHKHKKRRHHRHIHLHWGVRVKVLPKNNTRIIYKKHNYYYDSGVYYRKRSGVYVVSGAPVGLRIRVLPTNCRVIRVGGNHYYYYFGTYYMKVITQHGVKYEVINPPVGTIVYDLPEGYKEKVIDGKVYYQLNNILYKQVIIDDSEVAYKVVGN